MEFQPVNLSEVIAAVLVPLIFLVPVLGLTARFAIKPIVEALARLRETTAPGRDVELLAMRLREVEEEVIRLKNSDTYRALPASSDAMRSGQGRG